MAYSLGAVKPHVKAAAEEIGPKFGIRTVYGWAPGLHDHPKGLALDFMTSHKPTGDALVAYVLANHARLGVTYVIWYDRIWRPSTGWKSYSGVSRHRDHVHVSFSTSGGSGAGIVETGLGNPLAPANAALEKLEEIATWLNEPKNWLRLGVGALGVVLIVLAVLKLQLQRTAGLLK